MTKFGKRLALSIGPYKTVTIEVTDCESFKECDKELLEELDRHPDIKKLNAEEIKKVLG